MNIRIETNEAPAAIGPYSQAIKSGDFLFCSGQIPLDPKTKEVIQGSIQDQTTRVLQNLKAVFQAAGTSAKKVVKTTVFLTNLGDFQAFNEVYEKFFKAEGAEIPPARSTVQVAALPRGVAVEIEAIVSLR